MKLLLFAHTPPPHHGQSYMVQLMLEGFGGDRRKSAPSAPAPGADELGIECYHVNSRLSQKLEDIGDFRLGKFALLLGYCLQAIWCRFRYGVTTLYYIPAPGKHSALYRDWLVMLLCRPFFKRLVLHWHAAGLAKWLETAVQIRCRSFTYRMLKDADLSIVLSRYNRADAEKLMAKQIKVVSNGIPDPCPQFEQEVLPRRQARLLARRRLVSGEELSVEEYRRAGEDPELVYVLYLAHCTREKGLFDSLAGVAIANERLAQSRSPLSLRLLVTGNFVTKEERQAFDEVLTQPNIAKAVQYLGFVAGARKNALLSQADLFCFPTYYQNENQPVNLIEAMAFGLPILTTRWRSIPELFPPDYPGLVDLRNPEHVAAKLLSLALQENGKGFRQIFERDFALQKHLADLASALRETEAPVQSAALRPRAVPG
jgi:glycosyltransferase involved in cell wall biosynthesis